MTPLRVFIGYDPRQPVAFHVAAHSVMSRASAPVAITPLVLSTLPIKRRGLTEFTYSRFLVPWLCDYEGTAVFMDSDMLCRQNIGELFNIVDDKRTVEVSVVQVAQPFERPSLMVFDCARCRILTPQYIDDTSHPLFRLEWAKEIGALPLDWNHLVGYSEPDPRASLVHFTMGIPIWPETKNSEYAGEWIEEVRKAMSSVSFAELMGKSVHDVGRVKKTLTRYAPNHIF